MSAGFRKLLVEGKEYPSEFCASIKGTMYNVYDFSAKKRQRKETQNSQITGMQSYYFIKTLKQAKRL